MDRLLREGNPPVGQLASPKPQYKDVQTNDWEELKGEGGASYVKDKDALAKLEQARLLLASIDGKDFATDAKLGDLQTLLGSLDGKDFATQTTLAQVKTELDLIKTELETIKANQISGDQKVQLSGNIMEYYGATVAQRPEATEVPVGAAYMAVNTGDVWQSNGFEWVVL